MRKRYVLFLVLALQIFVQKANAQTDDFPLKLSKAGLHEISVKEESTDGYEIVTLGNDPYLFTEKLAADLPKDHYMLSFEYFCPTWLDDLQIWFGEPITEERSIHTELGVAEGWKIFSIDVKDQIRLWGKGGDFIRLDFGRVPNYKMKIRNIRFRKPTVRELEITAARDQNKIKDSLFARKLENYLDANYSGSVARVSVTKNKVNISGKVPASGTNLYLAEIPLYQNVTERDSFERTYKLNPVKGTFTVSIDRYIMSGGLKYDRIFSKWAVVAKDHQKFHLQSHARYADQISPKYNLVDEKPWNKKGLGGFHSGGAAPVADLDSLNISSVTVNIWITQFIRSQASDQTMPFIFNGKTYFVNKKAVEGLDQTLQLTASKKIIVSAIILVEKASSVADSVIGKIFEHPDCDPKGIYSMANVTSAKGLEYYAAIMDFLAARYSRPDKLYGRIHHWIMHNEVDAGWVWTNMGEKPPMVFMDDYIKSMRTVYNIARSYNANAKVFISLTHYWNWTVDPHFYHPKELLEILLRYSKAEGDFEWAIAQHPYPESLFEPKTWLDQQVDFTFNTPLITYKNIEVLDAWVKQPKALYKGKYVRTIHLSEQGFNSPDYSAKSLSEQAAGMAYAWKKIKNLKSIEANQYHNWMDNRGEGGLRIGLRRFPDDKESPAGKKPIWNIFRDMDTPAEDAAFEPSKKLIGLKNWVEIIYLGGIK